MSKSIIQTIASELDISQRQIEATVNLLDDDNTIPFSAEITGSLDEEQLRAIAERLIYPRNLTERKQTILCSIIKLRSNSANAPKI